MMINASKIAQPAMSLDSILEKLLHDFRETFTREFAPYPIELSFKVKIPAKVRNKLIEHIPGFFQSYGFKILNIENTEDGIIIHFE